MNLPRVASQLKRSVKIRVKREEQKCEAQDPSDRVFVVLEDARGVLLCW